MKPRRARAGRTIARTFANPILPGFHPDPSICRVGGDFYLACSSFEYFPGVPIYHSRDLVHWRLLGHALTRTSQLDLCGVSSSRGIYAPTLRHHRGRFYLVTTLVDGGGNFLVTARRPEGPWSDPIWLDEEGFDPSLAFRGGRVYYTRNGKGADPAHPFIYQVELDQVTFRLCGRMRVIWRGTGGIWPEGPHLFHRAPYDYLVAAEGGTFGGHAQVVARARAPFGPFAPGPRNPILSHRDRRGHPVQATGHADVVTLADGSAWAVFLGMRRLDGHTVLGRETFLAPVHFDGEGWPMIGDHGQVELAMPAPPLSAHPFPAEPARDDFDLPELSPQWMFLRNPVPGAVSLDARPGFLRLRGSPETLDDVGATTFVGRRQEHHDFCCQAEIDFSPRRSGEEAGLVARACEQFYVSIAIRLPRPAQRLAISHRSAPWLPRYGRLRRDPQGPWPR